MQRLSFLDVKKCSPVDFSQLQHLLVNLASNYETLFYKPIIGILKSNDNQRIIYGVRLIAFLTEAIGETRLFFGLDLLNLESLNRTIGRDSKRNSSVSSTNIPLIQATEKVNLQVPKHFISFLLLIVLGPSNVETMDYNPLMHINDHENIAKNVTLGHCCLLMELIWVIRRLCLASRYVCAVFSLAFTE